jgi:hypothetical protein
MRSDNSSRNAARECGQKKRRDPIGGRQPSYSRGRPSRITEARPWNLRPKYLHGEAPRDDDSRRRP